MIKLVLDELVAAVGGRARGPLAPRRVTGVATDSRTVAPGEVFFALSGRRCDGHDFLAQAFRRGALAAVVAEARALRWRGPAAPASGAPLLIEVDDPLAALGRLAAYHRRLLSAEVIAVAGSNGKTTTKALIDHLLSLRLRGRCGPGSFNNRLGVPLTLLGAEAGDQYLVVELGTSAPGEVARLAELARPALAVITCIGEEHLQGLGDLAGVAAEECSLLARLPSGGVAAVNIDAPLVGRYLLRRDLTFATFGRDARAGLRLTAVRHHPPGVRFTLNGRFEYRLPLPGAHNALNAAAAIAIARRFGLTHRELAARLESFVGPPLRAEVLTLGGVTLVNDAYNANPHSALAAIEMLESLPCRGRRVAVFGEMRELGALSAELHRRVAARLRRGRVDQVLLVGAAGELMSAALRGAGRRCGPQVGCCADVAGCAAALGALLRAGDLVLLKASRAVQLERVVEPLRGALGAAAAARAG